MKLRFIHVFSLIIAALLATTNETLMASAFSPTITVNKVIVNEPLDLGEFNLQINGTTHATGGDGTTTGSIIVDTGPNTVGETAGADTDLSLYTVDIVCRQGSDTGTIVESCSDCGLTPSVMFIAEVSTVYFCTIINTAQPAQLNINVDVLGPGFGTEFPFTTTGGLTPTSFSLQDGETQTFANLIPNQTYSVNEQVPTNWVLENILCSEPPPVCETGSVIVTPEPGQTIDATFQFRLGLTGGSTSSQDIPALSLWGLAGLISLFGLALIMWLRRRG